MSERRLHLNVNLLHFGVYASAWRLPESHPGSFFDVGHWTAAHHLKSHAALERRS